MATVSLSKVAAKRPEDASRSCVKARPERSRPGPTYALQQRIGNRATGLLLPTRLRIGVPNDRHDLEADRVADTVMATPDLQRCSCAGTCSKCAHHRQDDPEALLQSRTVQAKLTVNQPGDLYEREADRIADQVMRTPEPSAAGEISRAAPIIRRLGPATSAIAQRQADDAEEREEEEEPTVAEAPEEALQRMSGADAPEDPDDCEGELLRHERSGGGGSLPPDTRVFYESRLGRDLSAVRLHAGPSASRLAESIRARAFTHGNHVWLGSGLGSGPSHVLAHELVHVVQQTGPAAIAGSRSAAVSTNRGGPTVQRFAPYWEPTNMNGTRAHREILPALSRYADVFVEAPVPNADRNGEGFGKRGIADIYDADTTVGVYFEDDQQPDRLKSSRHLLSAGGWFGHAQLSAPRMGRPVWDRSERKSFRTIQNLDRAPKEISVADLKPAYGTIEALEGAGQVRGYLAGFKRAADEASEMSDKGRASPAVQWSPSLSPISGVRLEAMIPPRYRPGATDQNPRPLVLKEMSRAIRPLIRATGTLVVTPDPANLGILNYVWVPGTPPSRPLSARILALGDEVVARILNPLLQAPVANSIRETFDLGTWRTDRNRIRREYRAIRRTPEAKTAREAPLIVEAAQATETSTGLKAAAAPETVATARTVERVDFWTSIPAGIFGTFRRLFGRAFVRVYEGYHRMRERLGNWLRRQRAPGAGASPLTRFVSGKLLSAAVRVAFSLLKMAGVWVLGRTVSLLQQSLVAGLTQKLISLIPAENMQELRASVEQARELRDHLQTEAIRSAEDVVAKVFPGYIQQMQAIQRVMEIVSGIMRIVNLVKWGVRAISCVSPPALGCLWGIVVTTIGEGILGRVIRSCRVQRKIAPEIAGLAFVQNLPRKLASGIIEGVRTLLPEKLRDVFVDVESPAPTADEIECDDSETGARGPEPTDDQMAVMDLADRIGDERFEALLELLKASGVDAGVPMNAALAQKLGQIVEQNEWSALTLQRYAKLPKGKRPVSLDQLVEQLKGIKERSQVKPLPPPPEPRQAPPPDAGGGGGGEVLEETPEIEEGTPEYTTVVEGTRETEPGGGGGGGEGAEREPSPGNVQTAKARPSSRNVEKLETVSTRIVRVRGSLTEGATVQVDFQHVRSEGRRRIVRNFVNLECLVTEIAPAEEKPDMSEAFLEVTKTQKFVFSGGEDYYVEQGVEIVHQFSTQAAPTP